MSERPGPEDRAPGSEGDGDHRARRARGLAVLHARLSAGDGARRGRAGRGRRRQRLPRLHGRHRGHRHRALASRTSSRPSSSRRGKFLHMSGTDFYYEPQVRLGEELSAIAPMPGPHRSFFGNSGTEANEAAIKLARYYTKRHNIIAFLGAFHGRSMGSLSLTASKLTQRRGFGPFVPGVVSRAVRQLLSLPGRQSARRPARPSVCASSRSSCSCISSRPTKSRRSIVEPIQGEGGYVVPPDVFLQRLREITRQHGMLLIVDEVQPRLSVAAVCDFVCDVNQSRECTDITVRISEAQ